jgi:periplasmic protein CpxP/Spy
VPALQLAGHQHLQKQKHLIFTNQHLAGTAQIHGRITLQASHQRKDVFMKSIRTTLIATALMAGLTGLALAQNTTEPNDNPRVGRMEKMREYKAERHTERHMQRLVELKSKLSLQAAQEPAWMTFTQSMQHPGPMARPERASFEKLTTPERLDMMQTMKAARDTNMQQRSEATKAFYASLSAEQKQVFDQETARMMKGYGTHAMKHQGGHGRY